MYTSVLYLQNVKEPHQHGFLTIAQTCMCTLCYSFCLSPSQLDSKAPQGRCWPCLSRVTPASVCNTTTSAVSLPQGIIPARELCMQKRLLKDRHSITTVRGGQERRSSMFAVKIWERSKAINQNQDSSIPKSRFQHTPGYRCWQLYY